MKTEKPWLLLDTNCLLWRAFYGRPSSEPEEILYNLLDGLRRDTALLCERFQTNQIAFCFDHGKNKREVDFPYYKAHRHSRTASVTDHPREVQTRQLVREKINYIKEYVLGQLGYSTVYYEDGYEADDLIAKLVLDNNDLPFCVVSDDEDLFQLLHPVYTWIYQPRKKRTYTYEHFLNDYGIAPESWPDVKALGGCRGDNVRGCPGVGEVVAAKAIAGRLPAGSVRAKKCDEFMQTDAYRDNLRLVKLPYEGCPDLERPLVVDPTGGNTSGPISIDRLNVIAAELGLPLFEDPDRRDRPVGVRRRK